MKKHAKKSIDRHNYFGQILKKEMYDMEPEDYTANDFASMAANEAWNLDEFTSEGYMMLKHMLYRLVTDKKDWDNGGNPAPIQLDKFIKIVKKAYKEKLNEK